MTRPLLRLALLVLTADRALAFVLRNVTEWDPHRPYHPLLHWPRLTIRAWRQKLECVPDHEDENTPEKLWVHFDRNGITESGGSYGARYAQDSAIDYFFRINKAPHSRGFDGVWRCIWWTRVRWQGNIIEFFSPYSVNNITIYRNETPVACGVPFEKIRSGIPLRYHAIRGKRHAKTTAKRDFLKDVIGLQNINKRDFADDKTKIDPFKNMNYPEPNFGNIRDGVPIEIKQLPWVVSIKYWYPTANGNMGYTDCTGGFVSNVWVITAGHCFPGASTIPRANSCFVYAGTNRRYSGGARKCRRIFKHPRRDVALIMLYDFDDPDGLSFLNNIYSFHNIDDVNIRTDIRVDYIWGTKICLPDNNKFDEFDRLECYAAGYGVGSGTGFNRPLHVIKVKIESMINMFGRWKDLYPSATRSPLGLFEFMNNKMIMSGAKAGTGDSGGVVACRLPGTQYWQMAGVVVATGHRCFWSGYCRDYIRAERASTIKDWILGYMNRTARNIDRFVSPQQNMHVCSATDVKCGGNHCVARLWFRDYNMDFLRRSNIEVYNWVHACQVRLAVVARKVPNNSSGYVVEIGKSSSMSSHNAAFDILVLWCISLILMPSL